MCELPQQSMAVTRLLDNRGSDWRQTNISETQLGSSITLDTKKEIWVEMHGSLNCQHP
jgi:hypothetical protein